MIHGRTIEYYLKEGKISLKELSNEADVSEVTLNNVIYKNEELSFHELVRVYSVLGLSMERVVRDYLAPLVNFMTLTEIYAKNLTDISCFKDLKKLNEF